MYLHRRGFAFFGHARLGSMRCLAHHSHGVYQIRNWSSNIPCHTEVFLSLLPDESLNTWSLLPYFPYLLFHPCRSIETVWQMRRNQRFGSVVLAKYFSEHAAFRGTEPFTASHPKLECPMRSSISAHESSTLSQMLFRLTGAPFLPGSCSPTGALIVSGNMLYTPCL